MKEWWPRLPRWLSPKGVGRWRYTRSVAETRRDDTIYRRDLPASAEKKGPEVFLYWVEIELGAAEAGIEPASVRKRTIRSRETHWLETYVYLERQSGRSYYWMSVSKMPDLKELASCDGVVVHCFL